MGWLLDSDKSNIFVYDTDKSVEIFEAADVVVPVPEFAEAVQLTIGEIFDWLKA